MSSDDFPVHSEIDVVEGTTIYKTEDWWKAALVFERYGRKIGVYLWHKENGRWKRKQKYVIRERDDWKEDRAAIEALLPLLEGDTETGDSGTDSEQDRNVLDELVDDTMTD